MSIAHAMAVRTSIAGLINDTVNGGTGVAAITVREGSTVLASFPLQNPAFTSIGNGQATIAGLPLGPVNAIAGGDADNFQVLDRDGTMIFQGSVTATGGGGDMTVGNISIALNQPVKLDTFTYTAAP